MRVRCTCAAIVASLALASRLASAGPIGSHLEFTQFGGYTMFSEDRNALTGTQLEDGLYLGGRLGYMWKRWLGFEAAGGFTPTQEDRPNGEDLDFWHISGNILLVPYSSPRGWPFLSIGAGGSQLKLTGAGGDDKQGNAEVGGGIQLWFNDAIGIRLEARDLMWMPKDDPADILSHDIVVGGGLTFAIGATPRDSDGDGVPDRRDTCPNTPAGARVSATGCPTDADGDAVWDGIDQCADTPKGALVDARGCPTDTDGDAVADGIDQCADTPKGAKVDDKGCPTDSDGDGVADGLDQCESTVKGCRIDDKGCPVDEDRDGVCDGLDQCPGTGPNLRVDQQGCPIEVSEKETELLDTGMIRLENVEFETARADLKPEGMAQLDIVGQVLTKWPDLKIEIGGHTDSRGSNLYNQNLSEKRVKTVLDYLLLKFPTLKPEQYTAQGYGEVKPLVPNVSPAAMAKNRRVEFVVLNREVLKREIERRRLLEKNDTGN